MHLVKTILTAGLLLSAAAQAHNVLEFPQPENNPEEFYAVTEIPTGGIIVTKVAPVGARRLRWEVHICLSTGQAVNRFSF